MAKSGRRVIIALDASEHSDRAFHFYIDHLHKPDHEVILLHCPELSNVSVRMSKGDKPPYEQWREIWEEEKKRSEHLRQKYTSLLQSNDIKNKFDVQESSKPGEAIVQVAKEWEAVLVVMGSRGLGTLARTFMGSVSSYVIHHANCAVLVHQLQDS